MDKTLEMVAAQVESLAAEMNPWNDMYCLGYGGTYPIALEGALKLKEISYIHTEPFPAGELKHGTIALIEEGTPVIALATQSRIYDKMVSNIKEVKARGAFVIGITRKSNTDLEEVCDKVIYLEETFDIFMPLLAVLFP
ncbi:MAG: SIS domain-containing protein, partial [Methyloceanibacter sp.]